MENCLGINVSQLMFRNLIKYKYKLIFRTFIGNNPVLQVADPELIKIILVKDFSLFVNRRDLKTKHPIVNKNLFNSRDDDWKRVRTIASPTFTSGKMKKMYPLVKECLKEFLDNLESSAREGKDINLKDMHGNYTMDVIAKCAFATKTNAHKDPNNQFIVSAKNLFYFRFWRVIPAFLFPTFILKVLNIKSFFDEKANKFFFDLTRHILRTRRENNEKHNDFLQLLMDAKNDRESIRDESDNIEAHHLNEGILHYN